jgi:hypothetical protein
LTIIESEWPWNLQEFDELLVRVIDETIRYCLGDVNALILYDYLERKACPLNEIPEKPEVFSMELRNMLGVGRRQILGAASILEEIIVQALCQKLGIPFENGPVVFADHVRKLKTYYEGKKEDQLAHVGCV